MESMLLCLHSGKAAVWDVGVAAKCKLYISQCYLADAEGVITLYFDRLTEVG